MSLPDPARISVLIVDDHPPLRQGVRSMLEKAPDICVVGEAEDGDEARRLLDQLRPKIILLDLKMPGFSPVEFERWARENHPETTTLVLTAHDRDAYLSTMMESGAAGYLDKKLRAGQLILAIRRAACGEVLFDKEQIRRARRWREEVEQRWNSLSKRERQAAELLTEGAENKVIAASLGVTVSTAEKHLGNIYKKLGVTCRAEAAVWWLEKGGDFHN